MITSFDRSGSNQGPRASDLIRLISRAPGRVYTVDRPANTTKYRWRRAAAASGETGFASPILEGPATPGTASGSPSLARSRFHLRPAPFILQASEMGLLLGQLQQQWGVKKQQISELQQKQRAVEVLKQAWAGFNHIQQDML